MKTSCISFGALYFWNVKQFNISLFCIWFPYHPRTSTFAICTALQLHLRCWGLYIASMILMVLCTIHIMVGNLLVLWNELAVMWVTTTGRQNDLVWGFHSKEVWLVIFRVANWGIVCLAFFVIVCYLCGRFYHKRAQCKDFITKELGASVIWDVLLPTLF